MHGYIPPKRFLPYLTWTDIDALPDRENTVIVLPVGAMTQGLAGSMLAGPLEP